MNLPPLRHIIPKYVTGGGGGMSPMIMHDYHPRRRRLAVRRT